MMPALSAVGQLFSQQVGLRAIQVNAPSDIPNTIKVDSPMQNQRGVYYIDVRIEHPAAAAYEWGSGIHATRQKQGGGPPGEYPIPVQPTGVAFPKSRWPKYQPPPGKSIPNYFYFAQIMHPGVAPRPFITPTLTENINQYAAMLTGALTAEIFAGSERIEVIVSV